MPCTNYLKEASENTCFKHDSVEAFTVQDPNLQKKASGNTICTKYKARPRCGQRLVSKNDLGTLYFRDAQNKNKRKRSERAPIENAKIARILVFSTPAKSSSSLRGLHFAGVLACFGHATVAHYQKNRVQMGMPSSCSAGRGAASASHGVYVASTKVVHEWLEFTESDLLASCAAQVEPGYREGGRICVGFVGIGMIPISGPVLRWSEWTS